MPHRLVTALVLGTMLGLAGPVPRAEAAPAPYRVGQPVEAQAPDGNWYKAKVMKTRPGGEFQVRFEGLPPEADSWVGPDKLRAPGGGPVVDAGLQMALQKLRQAFAALDEHLKQDQFGNERWERQLQGYFQGIEQQIRDIERKSPGQDTKPMWEGVERRKKEIASKQGPVSTDLSEAELQEITRYYEELYQVARHFPAEALPEHLLRQVEMLEKLRFPEIDARMARDATRLPAVFKYYGSEDRRRFGDFPHGGPRTPEFPNRALKDLNEFHLPSIHEARTRLAARQDDLARTVTLAIEKAGDVPGAEAALRLARALQGCWPQAKGIAEQVRAAEAHLEATKRAIQAAADARAALAARERQQADAPAQAPKLDLSRIDSGVELVFSKSCAAGSPTVDRIQAGDFLYAHARFPAPILEAIQQGSDNEHEYFLLYLDEGDRELGNTNAGIRKVHLVAEQGGDGKGYLVLPLVSNPEEDCFVYANNLINCTSWEMLSKLSPGEHTLRARLHASNPKIEGVPLAVATLKLVITPPGLEQWKQGAPRARQAMMERGGELVKRGLRIEGPGGWKMTSTPGGTSSSYRVGSWYDRDFWIGIWKAGRRLSDHYQPAAGGLPIFAEIASGGYVLQRGGKVLARFDHQGNILDRDGKPWGRAVNEWERIQAASDLLELVPGLFHFGDLLRD